MKILVTGTAGFIGFNLANKLLGRGDEIIGLDNINDYYDVNLKYSRLDFAGIKKDKIEYNKLIESSKFKNYKFIKLNLEDKENLFKVLKQEKPDAICNLAAQAGVRYSLTNPDSYIQSNIIGFLNILEGCRHFNISNLVYASSSSVYGTNREMPFSEKDNIAHPVSLYAATKKSNELMAHTYSHLFNIKTTGLRFFTVYGPWGRPDMALFKFTKAILEQKPMDVFNFGKMERDFTYIDDIVQGIINVIDNPPKVIEKTQKNPDADLSDTAPYRVFNIGHGSSVKLMDFIEEIEKNLGKTTEKNMMPIQPGDVPKTWSDTSSLEKETGYKSYTSIEEGIKEFIKWYLEYYK